MAYLKELVYPCQSCRSRRAMVELFNFRNSSNGRFCRPCGNRELQKQKRREAEPDEEG